MTNNYIESMKALRKENEQKAIEVMTNMYQLGIRLTHKGVAEKSGVSVSTISRNKTITSVYRNLKKLQNDEKKKTKTEEKKENESKTVLQSNEMFDFMNERYPVIIYKDKRMVRRVDITKLIGRNKADKFLKAAKENSNNVFLKLGDIWKLNANIPNTGNPSMKLQLYSEEGLRDALEVLENTKTQITTINKIESFIDEYFHPKVKSEKEVEETSVNEMADSFEKPKTNTPNNEYSIIANAILQVNETMQALLAEVRSVNKKLVDVFVDVSLEREIETIKKEVSPISNIHTEVIEEKENLKDDTTAELLPVDEEGDLKDKELEWRKDIYNLFYKNHCRADTKTILCSAYTVLRNKYGICWEQLAKDYREKYGTNAVSTIRLAYFLEEGNLNCRGLLKSCVENLIIEKQKNEKNSPIFVEDVNNISNAIKTLSFRLGTGEKTLENEFISILMQDPAMHWRRLTKNYKEINNILGPAEVDPFKVAGCSLKSRKRAIVLYNDFAKKKSKSLDQVS